MELEQALTDECADAQRIRAALERDRTELEQARLQLEGKAEQLTLLEKVLVPFYAGQKKYVRYLLQKYLRTYVCRFRD